MDLATLEKLQPAVLPVNLLDPKHELYKVRKSFYYVYVMNWICNYKGHLRLASEYFDVELFEMELLNLFNPPPLDESVLFINKLKVLLLNIITNSSKFQAQDFDIVVKKFFIDTPLGDSDSNILFDNLNLLQKFEILFIILNYVSTLAGFRHFTDKNPDLNLTFAGKILSINESDGKREELLLLFNDLKLYSRITTFPEMQVPKKRKLSPEDPEDFYWDKFDIELSSMKFDIKAWSLEDFKKFSNKKAGLKKLNTNDFKQGIITAEIRKRRIIQNRKKEYQLLNLMATRKRSSRIEAKERQKQQELEDQQNQKEKDVKLAIELKKISKPLNFNSTVMSREDRLKMRKLNKSYRSESKEPEIVNLEEDEKPEKSEEIEEQPEVPEQPEEQDERDSTSAEPIDIEGEPSSDTPDQEIIDLS